MRTRRSARAPRLAFPLLLGLTGLAACSGGDGGTSPDPNVPLPTTDRIALERHRDGSTGSIVPVLTESGSAFDALEVDSPAVVFDADRSDAYLVYYEASDGTGASRIGVVSSTFADLSSLAIDRTVAVGLGAVGSGFEDGATDPTVVIEATGRATRYRMWFEGRTANASTIVTAVSDDGVQWTDFAVCTGLAPGYAARVLDPSVVVDGNGYRMWFEAEGGAAGLGAIGYASSTNGIDWTLRDASGATGASAGPVLQARGGVGFDAAGLHAPSVVFDPTADAASEWRWLLWYEASDQAASTENTLGLALSNDGLSWGRLEQPALTPSSDALVPLPFDSGDLEHPCVVVDPSVPRGVSGHFLVWYAGDAEANASPNRIGLARGSVTDPAVGALR